MMSKKKILRSDKGKPKIGEKNRPEKVETFDSSVTDELSDSSDKLELSNSTENSIYQVESESVSFDNLNPITKTSNDVVPKTSSISISKLDENNHALVFWVKENAFSVVSIFCVHSKRGEPVSEGVEYDISYGKKIYRGNVKCKESSCLNEQKKQIDLLKKENFVLKKKIVDLTEAYDYEQKQKSEYEDKIERLNIRIEQFEQTFRKDDIEKILKMSQIFQSLFNPRENEQFVQLVPLAENLTEIMVQPVVKSSVMDLIESCKEKQGGSTFRRIIQLLIPDITTWKGKTAKQIKEEFSHISFDDDEDAVAQNRERIGEDDEMNLNLSETDSDPKLEKITWQFVSDFETEQKMNIYF
ncbi:unnamed protein product [Brachionus calyciflorus]|uniref:Uncharacterized protein n=1 Tax=Brachionus calyciflorus TaxID=104777 RepID=A0A814KCR0_9BILA|nr:unnamed protein product [Brachionus calyciflorus]